MENAPAKGMSKGCLVLLIVGGIILVLAILGAVGCWIYREDLAKLGTSTLIDGLKTELATANYEGIDTVQFNAMADACKDKMNAETPFDWDRFQVFMGTLQAVMDDKEFTAEEVPVIEQAFVSYFPDLEEMMPAEPVDTLVTEEDSTETE